ncbi:hypothetical protein [Methanolobus sp. ZRKC5]|uniref:hypothetical protein n=1 Tax=unclassified Methanolobus TaxID=2629569 RepID=UPI00313F0C82
MGEKAINKKQKIISEIIIHAVNEIQKEAKILKIEDIIKKSYLTHTNLKTKYSEIFSEEEN